MSQTLVLKAKGLYTNSNQLSEVPPGALSKARNCVIDKDSVIESRRGFTRLTGQFAGISNRADVLSIYKTTVLAHRSDDNVLSSYNGTVWTDYAGTYSHPDPDYARMHFAEMNGNKYFTTSDGVMVLDSVLGPVYSTGMPKGLSGEAALTGSAGYLANNAQVAYRIVWGSKDASSNLYLGTASQRIVVSNSSGGTRDVLITFTIPVGIAVSDFYQVYRSAQSASSTTEPNDELQLVYEASPTAAEITAKSITVTDQTPDSLRGAFLYSNANQEGTAESNDIPPFAKDMCAFKNFMFFAGLKTKFSLNVKILAVSGANGIVLNDTITIAGIVYTAKAAESVASREFKFFTAGSASQNIDDTAKSLVKVVNQAALNTTIYAYYVSGYTDLPGQIFLERRSISTGTFSVSASRLTSWDLDDGVSDNNEYPNGLSWSKIQQPEHVPSSHLEFVGSKNSLIRRILPLRDSLFILKDDGVFRLTGANGSWSVDPLDTSTHILAPESAVVVNNQIFALTDQGIVTISDVGVAVISRPIEDQLTELIGLNFTNLKRFSFGVGYETDRKYILYTISTSADTYPTKAFVYNTFTKAFTIWDKPAKHAIVNENDDLIYLVKPDEKFILKERKSFSFRDFIDEQIDGFSIVSVNLKDVVVNTTSGLSIGDLISQSSVLYSPIVSINSSTSTITLNDAKAWAIGSIQAFKAIESECEWVNQSCENPGIDKHFQEVMILFREKLFTTAKVSFYTDLVGGYSDSLVFGTYGSGLWGTAKWGINPWGGITRPKPLRVFIPREKSRGTLLSIKIAHKVGYGIFAVNGLSLQYEFVSERANRS